MPRDPLAVSTLEVSTLGQISPAQWKSGIAAWLGWLFDGLDMHLYTLIAAPFVAELMHVASATDDAVKARSSWIQAAFLVGWALGGGFFGRLGDVLGRSRALSLTILTYAAFTGLSFFAQTWWQLLIFRFVAALGIGGEWAVGSCLLAEMWPSQWRPWIAAVLQTAVNIGVLIACAVIYVLASFPLRSVFLVGVVPALLVFWIRRNVPEPAEWATARSRVPASKAPGIRDLFAGSVRRTTLLTIGVCACSLTAWWAFLFWNSQHLRNLPDLQSWSRPDRERLVSAAFFLVIATSIFGNFFAGWLAQRIGYRNAIAWLFLGFLLAMLGAYRDAARSCVADALDRGGGILLRRLRPLHDVPPAPFSDAAAHDRSRLQLQHRPDFRRGGDCDLRPLLARRRFSHRPALRQPADDPGNDLRAPDAAGAGLSPEKMGTPILWRIISAAGVVGQLSI